MKVEFTKGYLVDGEFIGEGSNITVTTTLGEIFQDVELIASSKKRLGFQISGELSSRLLEMDLVEGIEKV